MTIVRYNPWIEMNSLQRQLDKMFNEVVTPEKTREFGNFARVPAAELTITEEALILRVELPGIDVADVDIEATAKSISISGERKYSANAEAKGKTKSEFYYGNFQRVIPLPVPIKNTAVKAAYNNGILELTLPKLEAEQNKVVKVNLDKKTDETPA